MAHKNREAQRDGRSKQTVIVVGGHGGLSDRYREVAAEHGWDLVHYEKKVPGGARHGIAHVTLVVVIVGMVSHTLRDQVKNLAAADAPVVYLRTAFGLGAARGRGAGSGAAGGVSAKGSLLPGSWIAYVALMRQPARRSSIAAEAA